MLKDLLVLVEEPHCKEVVSRSPANSSVVL